MIRQNNKDIKINQLDNPKEFHFKNS